MPLKISELHEYALMTLAARKKQYLQTPANIVEHFNNELENVNSYNGRQLLEMLQNADDAASKPDIKKKALIRLIGDELTIANNGHPFSIGGLESILYSNLSPKVMEQNMIGQKGLGFRSVLSWSQEVTILSDGVSLKFSKKIAEEFLEGMLTVKPSIREYLATKTKEKNPIAVLRVPRISTLDSDLKGTYDTFVIIKLKPDVIEKVQEQINDLVDGETLIFLNHLEEIELISPERNEKIIKKATATGVRITVINGRDNPAINWLVNEDKGTYMDKNYNLKVAWTKDLIYHSGIVHSFFKTRQTFPFPGLIHGTFELNSDRNDLIKDPDGKNEFLLGKLSELLVDTALKIASSEKKSNYKPLQLLNIETNKLTSIFVDYKFADSLIDAIKKAKVFPSVNGHYLDFSEEPVFYAEPVAQFIRGKDLDNLLLHTTESTLISLLDKITYYRFAPIDYSKIINKRIGGDPKMLSVLIRSFIRSNKTDLQNMNGDFSSLFPIFGDEAGKAIPWTKKMFLPTPFSGEKLSLPEEIELAFLDSRLSDELLTHFGINDYIYLDTRLAPFHFHRFTLEVFAAILKEVYLTNPTAGNVGLFHQNLYLLKKRSQERGENPLSQPSYAELPAINKAGKISKISSLFIGANFGDNNLAQELFEKTPEKLLADARTFGLKRSQSLKEYFYWLGAKSKPAKVNLIIDRKHKDYTAYKEFFLSRLRYPEKIGGQLYTYKNHASQALDGFQIQSFEDTDYILKNVKHEIIFKWIQSDHSLKNALEQKYDGCPQTAVILDNGSSKTPFSKMPNFLKWKFSTTPWIPSSSGTVAPQVCLYSRTIVNSLSPLLVQPKLDRLKLARHLDITAEVMNSYLRIIGINSEVSDLSTNQLYGMLFSLKQKRIPGKLAKYLYREVLQNFENEDDQDENYLNFIKNGFLWSTKGNVPSYQPVAACRYVDTKKYSDNIIVNFHLAALDRKQGIPRVFKRLGVKPLNDLQFSLNKQPKLHLLNDTFKKEMEHYKAIVYAFRYERDKDMRILKLLKKLDINIVTNVRGQYISNGASVPFELENYDFIEIQDKSNPQYFIKIPPSVVQPDQYRSNLSFGESIAEIFTTIFRSDERRSFMRDLYFRRPQDREELFVHEIQTDGYQKLERSKELLNLITDRRANFWRAYFESQNIAVTDHLLQNEGKLKDKITNITGLTVAQVCYFLDKAVYNNLGKPLFLQNTYDLFSSNDVDVASFYDRFEEIDFSPLFQSRYHYLMDKYQEMFSGLLYEKVLGSGNLSLKKSFYLTLQEYSTTYYSPSDGFQPDMTKHFFEKIVKRFGVQLKEKLIGKWSLNKLQKEKMSGFLATNNHKFESWELDKLESQSLILFDEWLELIRILLADRIGKIPKSPSKPLLQLGTHSLDSSNKQTIGQSMDKAYDFSNLQIVPSGSIIPTIQIQRNNYEHSASAGLRDHNLKNTANTPEEIGFIGEKFVYEALCHAHGKENVKWVSENGKSSGVNPIGMMGLGYDITYVIDEQTRLVEVKCIASTIAGFVMTDKEMQVALQDPSIYDLITVEGLHNTLPLITQYCRLFEFDEDQSLFKNSKFTLKNDTYKISFIKA